MIAIFANDEAVQKSLAQVNEVFVPIIVLGELYYGAHKSAHVEENIAHINDFAASSSVLVCNTMTSQWYGRIKNSLRMKGRALPENDIWIAAIARQYGLTLISRDSHFKEVDDLLIEVWE